MNLPLLGFSRPLGSKDLLSYFSQIKKSDLLFSQVCMHGNKCWVKGPLAQLFLPSLPCVWLECIQVNEKGWFLWLRFKSPNSSSILVILCGISLLQVHVHMQASVQTSLWKEILYLVGIGNNTLQGAMHLAQVNRERNMITCCSEMQKRYVMGRRWTLYVIMGRRRHHLVSNLPPSYAWSALPNLSFPHSAHLDLPLPCLSSLFTSAWFYWWQGSSTVLAARSWLMTLSHLQQL